MATNVICSTCGTVGDGKTSVKGSFVMELALWCLFLLPGLIYSVWRLTTKQKVCRACGGSALVPLDTPVGMRLAAEHRPVDRPLEHPATPD